MARRPWTEADYAQRGLGRIGLRLPLKILMQLRLLAASENKGKAQIIETLISAEHKRVFHGK